MPRCPECLQGAVTQTAGRAPRPHLQGCRGAREACRGHTIIKITNAEGAPCQERHGQAPQPSGRQVVMFITREHASTRGGAVTSVSVGESNWGDCGHNTEQPVSPRPRRLLVGRHAGTDAHVTGTGTHPRAPRPFFGETRSRDGTPRKRPGQWSWSPSRSPQHPLLSKFFQQEDLVQGVGRRRPGRLRKRVFRDSGLGEASAAGGGLGSRDQPPSQGLPH